MLPPLTNDQTINLIAEKAKSGPDSDLFMVKIMGRRSGPVANNLATLARARIHHIANAETWVQRLLGGGEYALSVFHVGAEHERIGSPITLSIPGQPIAEIDTNIVNDPSWDGPPELRYPMARPQAQATMMGTPRPVIAGYGAPSVAPVAAAPLPVAQAQGAPQNLPDYFALQRDFEARQARLTQAEFDAKLARDRAEMEAKHQRERLELEQKMNSMMNDTKRQMDTAANAGKSTVETVTAIAAALAPLVSAVLQSNAEAKKEAARLAAEAAAESRRAQEQMLTLVVKMGERPTQSPELQAMLELSKQQSTAQGEMMTRMVDAMSTVSKTSVAMIETVAELSAPPEGSPVLDAVKEGVKAMVALTKGTESGARKIIQTQQQLPAQTQSAAVQQAQRQAQQQRAAQQQAQANAHANTQRAQANAEARAVQAEVIKFEKPEPQPNMPPAIENAGFNGLDSTSPEDQEIPPAFPAVNSVDYVEKLIREKYQPVDYTATAFVKALSTPEMQAELEANDNDVEKLVAARLGEWLLDADNYAYLESLVAELEKMGIFESEGEEQAEVTP